LEDKPSPKHHRVLVVEDSATQALQLRLLLESDGFLVDVAACRTEAIEFIAHTAVDVIAFDLMLPDSTGIDGLKTFLLATPRVPVVVLTANAEDRDLLESLGDDLKFVLITSAATVEPGEALAVNIVGRHVGQELGLVFLAAKQVQIEGIEARTGPERQAARQSEYQPQAGLAALWKAAGPNGRIEHHARHSSPRVDFSQRLLAHVTPLRHLMPDRKGAIVAERGTRTRFN